MKFTMKNLPIGLRADAPLEVVEARGTTLRVIQGRVWITQEGSVDDLFLNAGSAHTFTVDGKVLISAEASTPDAATIAFDAALSVAGRTTVMAALRHMLAWHPAPLTTRSTGYEGI